MAETMLKLLSPSAQQYAAAFTELWRTRGGTATLSDWEEVSERFDAGQLALPVWAPPREPVINWSKINSIFWVTADESNATDLNLLLALHPEADAIRDGLATGVPTGKLITLYAGDTNQLVRAVYERLCSMTLSEFEGFWAQLLDYSPGGLGEALNVDWSLRDAGRLNSTYHGTRGWVSMNIRDSSPLQELELAEFHQAAYKEEHLIDTVANVFYWHRERSTPTDGFASLPHEVNHIHLTQAFTAALAGAGQSRERKFWQVLRG